MNRSTGIALAALLWVTSLSTTALGASDLTPRRVQVIPLVQGWNSVFLEVDPVDLEPAALFNGTPIDIVASYYAPTGAAQFVSDPGADLFRRAGWGVWYAEDRPDAFLKSLHGVSGQRAYLIHSREDYSWKVTGEVVMTDLRWESNAFNFVGFAVDEDGSPTFAQFFTGSDAHQDARIYRLSDGAWRQVTDPGAETMKAGEAFWIYCEGASTFQGPLRVNAPTRHGILLGNGVVDLTLRNDAGHPITPKIEHLSAVGPLVPLSLVVTAVASEGEQVRKVEVDSPFAAAPFEMPPLEEGAAIRIPLTARLQDMSAYAQVSLLRITTDLGAVTWVPVVAIREDLQYQ